MKDKAVGEVDCLKGVLNGEPHNIFAMKDVDYSMKLMSTYGNLSPETGAKIAKRFDGNEKHVFPYSMLVYASRVRYYYA